MYLPVNIPLWKLSIDFFVVMSSVCLSDYGLETPLFWIFFNYTVIRLAKNRHKIGESASSERTVK